VIKDYIKFQTNFEGQCFTSNEKISNGIIELKDGNKYVVVVVLWS
jgi:hypothetical protein